jgi:hypothetical protein
MRICWPSSHCKSLCLLGVMEDSWMLSWVCIEVPKAHRKAGIKEEELEKDWVLGRSVDPIFVPGHYIRICWPPSPCKFLCLLVVVEDSWMLSWVCSSSKSKLESCQRSGAGGGLGT